MTNWWVYARANRAIDDDVWKRCALPHARRRER